MAICFKPINGYGGRYLVSDQGGVYSTYSKRIRLLSQKIDRYGYPVVALSRGGVVKHIPVHRLVAMAFVENPYNKPCVNHINEDKTDNRAVNLEWVTVKENDNHGTRNVRMANSKKKNPVVQMDLYGKVIAIHACLIDAQRTTGLNRYCIREVCRGNRKTAGGYKWKYRKDIEK